MGLVSIAGGGGAYFDRTLDVHAEVAELVDALDLGSSGETRPGSSPGFRIAAVSDRRGSSTQARARIVTEFSA